MIIEELDGTQVDIEDLGLVRLAHIIPSADIEHTKTTISGLGDLITASRLDTRTIKAEFLYQVRDIYGYYLIRDEINALFARDDPYYIIFKREPYQRWLVKTAGKVEVPPNTKGGTFTVDFVTVKRFAESTASTATVHQWDVDKWGWNDVVDWDNLPVYNFYSNSFVVDNLGTAPIDPREMDLEITIRASGGYLQMTNRTNGDVFRYNEPLGYSDTLVLKNVHYLKNGTSVFRDTNKKLFTLNPGKNEILIEGASIQSIDFNFRFHFK